jgi:hypothetical protein
VLVEERLGVIESMSRSSALTQGSRWRIFWLLLLFVLFYFLVSVTSGLLMVAIGMGNMPMTLALQAIVSGIVALVGAAMAASLYIELRTVKEGATADGLAEILHEPAFRRHRWQDRRTRPGGPFCVCPTVPMLRICTPHALGIGSLSRRAA